MDFGLDYQKVWVTIAMIGKTPLYCIASDFHVLDDAIGSTITWLTNYAALN